MPVVCHDAILAEMNVMSPYWFSVRCEFIRQFSTGFP